LIVTRVVSVGSPIFIVFELVASPLVLRWRLTFPENQTVPFGGAVTFEPEEGDGAGVGSGLYGEGVVFPPEEGFGEVDVADEVATVFGVSVFCAGFARLKKPQPPVDVDVFSSVASFSSSVVVETTASFLYASKRPNHPPNQETGFHHAANAIDGVRMHDVATRRRTLFRNDVFMDVLSHSYFHGKAPLREKRNKVW
jgi:hypothetical protein